MKLAHFIPITHPLMKQYS